ncbi:MAG TPA: hypothetical protein VM123_12760 [archaeon]|nr:hypothetical protein [archaeon]
MKNVEKIKMFGKTIFCISAYMFFIVFALLYSPSVSATLYGLNQA